MQQIICNDALWKVILLLRQLLECMEIWMAVQCTSTEKWVTQPTEIQPVPFTDVELSLQHQAQLTRLHYQTLPTVSTQLFKSLHIMQGYICCFPIFNTYYENNKTEINSALNCPWVC